MSNLKIGDKVKFVLGTSLLTGTITKFYCNGEECSVKTEVKIYPHILLHRVSKIEDNQLNEQNKRIKELEEENQQLKDRWQKLKDDLMLFYTVGSTSGSYGYNIYKSIFDKMEELEGAKK